jgi:DNA-binding MarR family transcriptional regulator
VTPSGGDPPTSTGFLLWHVSLRWRVTLGRELAPLGLTHTQFVLLATLYRLSHSGAPPSQRQLADQTGLDVMLVSKVARALEGGGLVRRGNSSADPRALQLTLTSRGTDVVLAAVKVVHEVEARFLSPLGDRRKDLRSDLQALLSATHAPETLLRQDEPAGEAG